MVTDRDEKANKSQEVFAAAMNTASTTPHQPSEVGASVMPHQPSEAGASVMPHQPSEADVNAMPHKPNEAVASATPRKTSEADALWKDTLATERQGRRLLLDESQEEASAEGELWHDPTANERMIHSLQVLLAYPLRGAFSKEEHSAAQALEEHLRQRGWQVLFRPLASAWPIFSVAIMYASWAILGVLLGQWRPAVGAGWLGLLLVVLVADLLWGRRMFSFFLPARGSQALWMPIHRGQSAQGSTSQSSTSQSEPAQGFVHQGQSAQGRPTRRLLICASYDTLHSDLLYHPDPAAFGFFRQHISVGGIFLGWVCAMIGLSLARLWAPQGWMLGVGWMGLAGLVGFLAWIQLSERACPDGGDQAASVAVAIEVAYRLRELELPFAVDLVLLGGSVGACGMESLLRQWREEKGLDISFIHIGPIGSYGSQLRYTTHEGPLLKQAHHRDFVRSLDWAAARFGQFFPTSDLSSSPAWMALCHDVPSTTLSSGKLLSPKALGHAIEQIDLDLLDRAAGFVVAFAQHQTSEQDGH